MNSFDNLAFGTRVSVVIQTIVPHDLNLSLEEAITKESRHYAMTENYFRVLGDQCSINNGNFIFVYEVSGSFITYDTDISTIVLGVNVVVSGTNQAVPCTYTKQFGGNTSLISVNVL